ncbi:unnamed protein product [Blumeria hordei]|uniref:Uncharacterized protein n=1 Tax=Blumeria hordei TaxID=2867405 RepID=A0A383UW28_BLUHO|nr:unnamed protein product [Blumeria hordei]
MLLTSTQVSVTISTIVAILFTFALFLSGYVLQQRTLRDIRAIIRPDLAQAHSDYGLPIFWGRKDAGHGRSAWEARGVVDAILDDIINDGTHDGETDGQRDSKSSRIKKITPGQRWKEIDTSDQKTARYSSHSSLSRAERRKLIKSQILAAGE